MNIDRIASEALRLSASERAALAEALWASLEDPYMLEEEASDEEALRLAKERDDEIEAGAVTPLTHRDMMNRLRWNED